jgi:hypothetical protein
MIVMLEIGIPRSTGCGQIEGLGARETTWSTNGSYASVCFQASE